MDKKKYEEFVCNYKKSTLQQFSHYKMLADCSFAQLENNLFFQKQTKNGNSIAHIIQHVAGNIISRWTDFLTTDGEKENRKRDQEFEDIVQSKEELIEIWELAWECLFKELKQLEIKDWDTTVYIRKEAHTVLEAINRQLAHCSYHVGQIVFYSKLILGEDWTPLSIPRGESEKYKKNTFIFPNSETKQR